jgi:AcrR family transcriptional regulator
MSPRSKAQFEELREASMSKIMDASLELFGTRGYEATSINLIAKEAGVSKGLIYNYFESKEDLLKGLIDRLMKEGEDIMYRQITDDPKKNLEAIFRLSFKWMRENQQMNRLIFNLVMQVDKFDFVHQLAVTKMKEYLKILEGLLQQTGTPNYREEARIISILFDGIGAQFIVLREDYPLDDIEEILVSRYCM